MNRKCLHKTLKLNTQTFKNNTLGPFLTQSLLPISQRKYLTTLQACDHFLLNKAPLMTLKHYRSFVILVVGIGTTSPQEYSFKKNVKPQREFLPAPKVENLHI